MGSLPVVSILRGSSKPLVHGNEPILIHQIIENTIRTLESNNNDEKIETIHSISLTDFSAQDPALIDGPKRKSYSELNESSNKLARAILEHLKRGGKAVNPNSDGDYIIAVKFTPSSSLITTLLAILKTGAAYLPLDHEFPRNRIQHILNESQPLMVITDRDEPQRYENHPFLKYDDLKAASSRQSAANIPPEETLTSKVPDDEKIGIILYTSGSTGLSKGVRILHKAILNRLKWQWNTFPYEPTEKVCVFKTALTFVDSVSEIWGPLCHGRGILIIHKDETTSPECMITALEQFKVKRLVLVPTLLNSILLFIEMGSKSKLSLTKSNLALSLSQSRLSPSISVTELLPTNRLPDLNLWVCSGETLSKKLAEKFYTVFNPATHKLCNFYGSTEVMGDISYHIVQPEELHKMDKVPIGKPVDNSHVYILGEDFQPVPLNEIGEIYASGLNLAANYVKNRDANKFIDNILTVDPNHRKLFKTGDFARMVKDPVNNRFIIYYEGRTDSQIKVRGHRVDLSEVEAAISKIKQIHKIAVLTYKPGEIEQALLAYVTLHPPADLTERDVETQLQSMLTSYMMPRVMIIDHMPLLVNGKIDRQFLLKKYEKDYRQKSDTFLKFDYTGLPVTVKEKAKALFQTIGECLGPNLRGRITYTSNFFQLGGNSLNSVYTVAKLCDMGYFIGLQDFVSAKNLLEVANKMEKESGEQNIKNFTQIPDGKFYVEMLADKHKEACFDIISKSFEAKADLEMWLKPDLVMDHYMELLNGIWPHLVRQDLSFAVRTKEGEIMATAFNFDVMDCPDLELKPDNKLNTVFEILDFVEIPAKEKLMFPKEKGKVMHNFMAGVKLDTPPGETIELFFYMEDQLMKIAKAKGYIGVFTSNTNPLTQQLAVDVNHYETITDYQVNQWVDHKGRKPFEKAPDDQRIIVNYKSLL